MVVHLQYSEDCVFACATGQAAALCSVSYQLGVLQPDPPQQSLAGHDVATFEVRG